MKNKQALRAEIKSQNRERLSPTYRSEASARIVAKLLESAAVEDAEHIALFHALPDEPDLAAFIETMKGKKTLYLPRVEGDDIAFYRYQSEEELANEGIFGIAEPTCDSSHAVDPALLDLILVPGVAFDKQGNRMGRGKAYYDRFLPQTQAKLIGVVFSYRHIEEIPTDPWDKPMDMIITD